MDASDKANPQSQTPHDRVVGMTEAVQLTGLPRETLRQLLVNKKLVGRQRPAGRREWEISEESLLAFVAAQANLAMASGAVRRLRPPGDEAVTAIEEAAANLAGVVRALQTALDELRTEREAHEATRRGLAQVRSELEGMQSDLARARHWRELLDRLLTGPETAGD